MSRPPGLSANPRDALLPLSADVFGHGGPARDAEERGMMKFRRGFVFENACLKRWARDGVRSNYTLRTHGRARALHQADGPISRHPLIGGHGGWLRNAS